MPGSQVNYGEKKYYVVSLGENMPQLREYATI